MPITSRWSDLVAERVAVAPELLDDLLGVVVHVGSLPGGLAGEAGEYTQDEGVIAMGPKDVELGDEVIEVERRPRAGVVLSVRLSPDEADRLQGIAEARRTTLSQVAREAITSYLSSGAMAAPARLPGPEP